MKNEIPVKKGRPGRHVLTDKEKAYIKNFAKDGEIMIMVKGWSLQQYEEWKADILEHTAPRAVGFMRKVFIVIEQRCIEEQP